MIKNPPANTGDTREMDPWVRKIPWRRKWKPTPVFLPEKSHGHRSLVGYSPKGCKELDTVSVYARTCTHTHTHTTRISKFTWTDKCSFEVDLILKLKHFFSPKKDSFVSADVKIKGK